MSEKALEVSDEEFMKNPLVFADEIEPEDQSEEIEAEKSSDTLEVSEADADDSAELVEENGSDSDDEPGEVELSPKEVISELGETDRYREEQDSEVSEQLEEVAEESDTEDAESEEEETQDFEAFYKQLTAPFKANGKDMQIQSADDAIKLMQMGANYSRKMGALKPQLKVMRMLEQHELLDENKLSFLIDLHKQDPAAINQLLKNSKIDPVEIDLEASQEYKASNYSVNDSEIDLDNIVDELKDSQHFQPTLNLVTQEWDDASKQQVAGQPELLKVIHDHIASGVYDIVSTEVNKERVFGRLNGISDIEAYKRIGDSLQEKGAFDHLFQNTKQKETAPRQVAKSPSKKVDDQKLREKRRANSPTKRAAKGKSVNDFNPLNLSDEEFQKQFDPRFA